MRFLDHIFCPTRLIPLNLITTISSEEQHAVRIQACHNCVYCDVRTSRYS